MKKAYKRIISLAIVLIAGLNLIVPAFAQDPFTAVAIGGIGGASGAGLFGSMAGMSGIDIAWGNNTADQMDAMWNVLNPDHVYFSGEKHEANPHEYPEDVYDYIQVDIGDWLQAQSAFISEFCSNYNVSDNSSGTISNTSYDGLVLDKTPAPWYGGSSYYYCGGFVDVYIPLSSGGLNSGSIGNVTLTITTNSISNNDYNVTRRLYYEQTIIASSTTTININDYNHYGVTYYRYNSTIYTGVWNHVDSYGIQNSVDITNLVTDTSGSINWTSSTVDENVFNDWQSAKVKIPYEISQLSTGWTLSDFLNELDRIWYGGGEDNIVIENGGDVPPIPPVPIPSTPLGDVPFDDWIDLWGQGIYQQLENQSDALDLIGSNGEDAIEDLESIDSNLGDLNQTAESIDTNIGIGNGILGGIRSLAQSAVDYLQGIAEHVGELVEEIVQGTETLISGILNQIPAVFGVIFGPIKQASSIWHYVVEWIQSISAPMSWMWAMAGGTSYFIQLPLYASLAGAVVLAFYKRFGK